MYASDTALPTHLTPLAVSDVPGPNSYNVMADSQLDDYKRGAFLEKAERFIKDDGETVHSQSRSTSTGPVHEPKKTTKAGKRVQSQTLGDRYALLQRKVDDLERVHNDGKKAHQAEVERLKSELARCQKLVTEQTDRGDKQKKQIDLLESRIQDLKKTNATDQTEIRDLRVKLRTSEHEKNQLTTKQGEASEAKKSLQSLELKRREELREKDRRIAELYKSVMVPGENKPRTALTRVARVPLGNIARSLNASGDASHAVSVSKSDSSGKGAAQSGHALESVPGDMTIDEIM
ncbi:hypothetical protein C0993_004749 [Termitomyces sp. T159_Od127]|nr:hypothetical protein C0993_004749 [Termitomyces sp. T159_Od127]